MMSEYPSDPINDRQAQRWFQNSDQTAYVGSRHHTVPGLWLRRFAADEKNLLIWRRVNERIIPGKVNDLSITNFYTVMNVNGQLDGRMEELLGQVEDEAAGVIRLLFLSLRRPGPPTDIQKRAICQLTAFQMVRGPRKRREIELLAEYGWKMMESGRMSPRDLRDLHLAIHPNEHIRLMGPTSYPIYLNLMRRPIQLIRLDAPLLVISDEPVIVDTDEHAKHRPECSFTQAQMHRRQQRNGKNEFKQPIHIWPTRPAGVEVAEAIGMPLSPSVILMFGAVGEDLRAERFLRGEEAEQMADGVNSALVAQAYEWVAANPAHPTFAGWDFPLPSPILGVCDGGSVMSEQMRFPPIHRWQRIRKDWPTS